MFQIYYFFFDKQILSLLYYISVINLLSSFQNKKLINLLYVLKYLVEANSAVLFSMVGSFPDNVV